MCGKFTSLMSWRNLVHYSDLLGRITDDVSVLNTPMRAAPVVCLDAEGRRVIIPMRWGWIDLKASDPLKKPSRMRRWARDM